MLVTAIIFITLALLFYSIGVWAEKIKKILMKWHVIIFWFGFICDTIGTTAMGKITESTDFVLNFHSLTGITALALMLFHASWATFVIIKGSGKALKSFHKFSIIVWGIWLIPYISGMIMGMSR